MKKVWEEYQAIIIITVLVLAIMLTIYFWGKYAGKKYVPEDVDLPGDMNSGNTSFNPGKYTDLAWTEIDANFLFLEPENLKTISNLSDSQLVAVYNDFSKRYFDKAGKVTLTQALINRSLVPLHWGVYRDQIVSRLAKYHAD